MNLIKILGGSLPGALAGAIGLTALIFALMNLNRQLSSNGQAGMVVFLTVPVGAIAGALSGAYWSAAGIYRYRPLKSANNLPCRGWG